jgi:2-polyprenyl-6-methoxyphenol hydroxylase-like FAD-dependent oxidoreductase
LDSKILKYLKKIKILMKEGKDVRKFLNKKDGLTLQQSIQYLKFLDVYDEIKNIETPTSYRYFFNYNGEIKSFYGRLYQKYTDKGRYNLHISRQDLRYIFINKMKEKPIEWNKDLERIDEINNEIYLKFKDTSAIEKFDAVIGCDGVYSNVRKLFQTEPLNYLNVIVVLGIVYLENILFDKCTFEISDGINYN